MKRFAAVLLIAAALHGFGPSSAANAGDGVVVSIKPVHSLVAAIMHGAGTPHLIVSGNASPHVYAMRPSDARALEKAKLVFWVGPGLETFLAEPLRNVAGKAVIVALAETSGLERLAFREGGPWEAQGQAPGRQHGEHQAEREDRHPGAKPEPTQKYRDGRAGHGRHDRHAFDMHFWLDPKNAELMAGEIVTALAAIDPARSALYAANGEALKAKLAQLTGDLNTELSPVRDKPFIVFHDAYHYFEKRFGLTAGGSITVSPVRQPGAQRLTRIRHKIKSLGATCVFAEPQFPPRLLQTAVEGTKANVGTLDPLGADLEAGPELYFELMRRNAKALRDCLSKGS